MKRSIGSATIWLLGAHFTMLLILSLSCCGPSENPSSGTGTTTPTTEGGGTYPVEMVEALAKGKANNQVVMIELFDYECEYCIMMMETFNDPKVIEALSDVVYQRVEVTEKALIKEFEMDQSPTYLFFKHDGTYIDPYITGFRQAELFSVEIINFKRLAAGQEELPYPEDNHPDFGKG